LFPATYAASEDKIFKGGYNIDGPLDGINVCLIDSVGSQANRIEPMFMKKGYAGLVPQIIVKAGKKKVNLLEAGHRAGDAIVRCSLLQEELEKAFKSVLAGNAQLLAKIAPTSLVFGVWDSRETQAKLPRLIDSKIRAYNVRKLTRSAQYNPAVEYVKEELLPEPIEKKEKEAYAERGFVHVPATVTHGGVIAIGGVRRDATLHLAALRLLSAENDEKTQTLRRYILGLTLTAFTFPPSGYLRQGCNLVLDSDHLPEFKLVFNNGQRDNAAIKHEDAVEYAKAAAKDFGIDPDRMIDFKNGVDREIEFSQELAKKDLSKKEDRGAKSKKKTT
jgi:CRISPR-associated protein Csb1